jgi:Protein of unknown function (DUF3592)
MFNFLVGSAHAYNQVGMFLGALACLGLGGLILGNALYWRVHALRVSGTVVGVIAEGNVYIPVYRYTLPNGQSCEAKSDTGSNLLRGKETGRTVPLLISPHQPAEARDASNHVLELIGLVIALPGLWLGYTALSAYPITAMTWIMGAAMLFYLAERGYRIFVPKGQHLTIEEWKKRLAAGHLPAIDLTKVRRIEDIASPAAVQNAQQLQWRNAKWLRPVMALLAVVLLVVGIRQSMTIMHLQSAGLRAPGEVVRLSEERSSGHYSYYPIVRFRAANNVRVEFKDSIGSNPPSRRVGDKVTVLYLPDDLASAIIDRGVWGNWILPAVLFLFCAIVAGIGIALARAPKLQTTFAMEGPQRQPR